MYLFPSATQLTGASSISLFPYLRKIGLLVTFGIYLTRGFIQSLQYTYSTPKLTPVIITKDGAVQGRTAYSRDGQEYWQFLSIPYAQAPIGSLRFQPPVPAKSWGRDNVKQVVKWPPACVQFDPIFIVRAIGVEDCLFLNVFTSPEAVTGMAVGGNSVPVLVYFHGGAFLEGESTLYYPTFLMDHGPIVIVTCQYRLGPLGFLNFQEIEDPKYPRGNMGLKDQTLVLKWVKENIRNFGGNPGRVTIMGDSAGAASVSFHMVSDLSKGLFHRAVSISGSSLCPWAFTQRSRNIAEKYGRRVGCDLRTNTSDELLNCFLKMEASDLVKSQWSWADPSVEKDEFVPSVERIIIGNDTFLSERPIEIMKSGRSSKVPFLTGVTSGEGSLRSARFEAIPGLLGKFGRDWDRLIGRLMFFDQDPIDLEISNKIREVYFERIRGSLRSGNNMREDQVVLKLLTFLSGDSLFYEPVHTTALEHAKNGNPTYLFYYDYRSKLIPGSYSFYRAVKPSDGFFSVVRFLQGLGRDWFREKIFGEEMKQREVYGVGHAENAYQIWNALGMIEGIVEGDREFSEEFVRTFVEFVKGSEPTFRGVKWPRVNHNERDNIPFMLMDKTGNGKVISEPFADRMRFWEGLAKFRVERG